MEKVFLDTNILARFLMGDSMEQSEDVLKLFKRAKNCEIKLFVLPEVFIELNYVLKTQYKIDKQNIVTSYQKILQFSFVECPGGDIFSVALDIFGQNNISLEDSYFINFCLTSGLKFYSFDQKATRIFESLKKI